MRKKLSNSQAEHPRFVRYTMSRIAQDLDVSLTTVSRALSGTGRISEEKRRKIVDYAEELQRSTHTPPRLMKRMLGLFTPWYSANIGLSTPVASVGQDAVFKVCEERGYGMILSSFGNVAKPTVGDELLNTGALAGVVLLRTRDEAKIAAELDKRGLPHVFVYRNLEGCGLNYISVDFAEVIKLAVNHCTDLGFHDLCMVTGNPAYQSHGGYQKAFLEIVGGRRSSRSACIEADEITEEGGYRAAAQIFSGKAHPRAIICCSDRLALGVLRGAHDEGKRVPKDVAVVTIDGTLQTAYTRPSLTAIQIPWHQMFEFAAKFLIEMIEGGGSFHQIGAKLRCELIVRESTIGGSTQS